MSLHLQYNFLPPSFRTALKKLKFSIKDSQRNDKVVTLSTFKMSQNCQTSAINPFPIWIIFRHEVYTLGYLILIEFLGVYSFVRLTQDK